MVPESHGTGASPASAQSGSSTRIVTMSPGEFVARFGSPDVAGALCGYTPEADTRAVLTLVCHARPRRLLEVGTAFGHMTANLTRWAPDDASIFTLGLVRGMRRAAPGDPEQEVEVPPRSEWGLLADAFGTAHKAVFITADSMTYDFGRLAPLDFAFIDGGHDLEHVLNDSRKAYDALTPGGWLVWHDFGSREHWVRVREAVEQLGFVEPAIHVEGTEVAFVRKQAPGAPTRTAPGRTGPVRVAWEGDFEVLHSMTLVNRAFARELLGRGHDLGLIPDPVGPAAGRGPRLTLEPRSAARLGRGPEGGPAQVHVRHQWPPRFNPPPRGRWVLMQPWEFGSLPRAWLPMLSQVDEVWAYSRSVRDVYLEAGVPSERVHVVPLGVDPAVFRPGLAPFALPSGPGVRFLFVGGTLFRKGIDVLLNAYARAFRPTDGVGLMIKDMGSRSFYRGQTAENEVEELRRRGYPVEYIDRDLPEPELAGLYAACDCLVHPFRGEGFALPVVEAMACGLPVIVTDAGPVRDYATDDMAFFIPAVRGYLAECCVVPMETIDRPWLSEPDADALVDHLRRVAGDPTAARTKGAAGSRWIHEHFTWAHAAAAAEARLHRLIEYHGCPRAPAAEGIIGVGSAAETGKEAFRWSDLRLHHTAMTTDPTPDVASLLQQANTENLAGREREAAEILERALAIAPESIEAKYGLATIRSVCPRGIADLETALRLARELLTDYPRSWDSHFVAAVACYYLGREDEFSKHWDATIALMPATSANFVIARHTEALMRLEAGDFAAWPDYDYWKSKLVTRRNSLKDQAPRWEGDRLDGRKIFLHTTLDGFGDAIQMARYIPSVKAMGGHVTLVCYPSLGRLFIQSGDRLGFDCIIGEGARVPAAVMEHDVQAALMSLPALFKTTPETIPDAHFLVVGEEAIERWRPICSAIPGFRVGVCWAGSPSHRQDAFRSFRPAELAPMADIPGVSLVNLQKGRGTDQLANVSFPVVDLGPEYAAGDWLDTAAVISQLDLIVTPDTALAHLAGALATPVWMALHRPAEWRWMRDRDDSPWYPTMRLFRQDKLGEWGPVFRRMADALDQARHPIGQANHDRETFEQGEAFQESGDLARAEQAYRSVLRTDSTDARAWYSLGDVCLATGRAEEAVSSFREAIRLRPEHAPTWKSLGVALGRLGRAAEAKACNRRTLQLQAGHSEAGAALPGSSSEACRRDGFELCQQGRFGEAEARFHDALALKPDSADALNDLGTLLGMQSRPEEAVHYLERAIAAEAAHARAHSNLAAALYGLSRLDEAEAAARRALELKPDYTSAHNNLGMILHEIGRPSAAEQSYREALRRVPDHCETLNNLADVLVAQGRAPEALEFFDRALALKPDFVTADTNRLLALQYVPGVGLSSLAEAHLQWDRRNAALLRSTWRPFDNDRDPDRTLRLGFVSHDFRRHPVGYLIVRVLEGLRALDCETYCYHTNPRDDDLTERIAAASYTWHRASGVSDQALADRIRADRVDLLFDMAGHTSDHRLLVFARKPAPIQLMWLGYPGTTGLAAIDYLVADRFLVPPGAEEHYSERVLRLPDDYACYEPPAEAPAVAPLPALASGHVTFSCFNNPAKVGPDVVATWAEILRRVPGSRLLLKYRGLDDPGLSARYVDLFAGRGIDPDRIEFEGNSPIAAMFAAYGRIDLGLDPFPYSGGITTCDASWMGVPVVTCPGDTFAGRLSLSHLSNAGLTETIARDLHDYVEQAVALAQDLPRLAALRAGMRPRMASSPLCDADRFVRNLFEALRAAWREWCAAVPS